MIDEKRWQEIDEKEPIPSHILERMEYLRKKHKDVMNGSNVHHRLKVSEKLVKSIQVF